MLLPKWLVIVLFIVAIGSTGGLLFLLTQRSFSPSNQAIKNVPVVVSASPESKTIEAFVPPNATASASPLSATAEWKKYSSNELSIKLEYPANWFLTASDSAKIKITSYDPKTLSDDKMTKEVVQMAITRQKKESSSQKLTAFLEERLKFYKESAASTTVKEENARTIDSFDGVERLYSSNASAHREIVFATKNYYYLIYISPSDTLLKAGVDELLKTVEII
ncbi:MAG: hypothetical protein M3Q44_01355 [bacterium]|nr:hypothetical protein [bacterium]